MHAAIQREFVRRQVLLREQVVLVEQEVGHHATLALDRAECGELVDALEQEGELGRQAPALGLLVEAAKERVELGLLEHRLGLETVGQAAGEGGLAGADRTFDDDVAGLVEHAGLSLRRARVSCGR